MAVSWDNLAFKDHFPTITYHLWLTYVYFWSPRLNSVLGSGWLQGEMQNVNPGGEMA